MDVLLGLTNGFADVIAPSNLLFLVGGVVIGMVLGAIPGLTATMAIALVLPLTYTLTPIQSLTMMLAAYNAGTFGGSMAAILIGTPGTPAAAATVADGYALARKGQAGKAIKDALYSSVFGCLFSSVILIMVAGPISTIALNFGPSEYAVLMLFSLTIIASAAGRSLAKGLIGGALGLLFGCVGMDSGWSTPRFSFGFMKLTSGINLVVMLIGALAMSALLIQLESIAQGNVSANLPTPANKDDDRMTRTDIKRCLPHWLRSSMIGCGIGALPGLGPSLACYIGYDFGKKSSKHPEEFGTGSIEGIAASEAANNSVCSAALIPLLALGVPGDTGAALLMSAFIVQGLTPGPLVFTESIETVYGIYAGFILCNLVLLGVCLATWKLFRRICSVSVTIIFPAVAIFCVIGVYAFNQNVLDIWIMLFFGVVGYILTKFKFPITTLLIGFILSPLLEKNFRRALVLSRGNPLTFFSSPLCLLFWAATVLSLFFILRGKVKDKNLADGL